MATVKMVRYANRDGKRARVYDRSAIVGWKLNIDAYNRIEIETEHTKYYTTIEWLLESLSRKEGNSNAEVEIFKSKSGVKTPARNKKTT